MTDPSTATDDTERLPDDVRLVVCDLDGTLLDPDKNVPDELWPLLATMRERGIAFAPASGRQYQTLASQFARLGSDLVVIAENGAHVRRGGREVFSASIASATAHRIVRAAREVLAAGRDIGTVVCGKRSAYIERADDAFVAESRRYYEALEVVDDLTAVADDVLKVAVYDCPGASHEIAQHFDEFAGELRVVVSGDQWLDLMPAAVDKGTAVQRLQRELDVTRAQTVAFGDYLNDLEMLDAAEWSFAMANAHPDVKARARFLAPSNAERGVIVTLARLLGMRTNG